MPPSQSISSRRIAYLSLQAVAQGQDTWAAALEVIHGMRDAGWTVDEFFPSYGDSGVPPPAPKRIAEIVRLQLRLARRLRTYDAVYVRSHVLAWFTALLAHRRGVPVIQECNGGYEDLYIAWPATRRARWLFDAMVRWQYRRACAVICVTPQLAQWVRAESGRNDADVSGNGANIRVFSPDAPPREGLPRAYAVFFGQFAPWQGVQIILNALECPEWPAELSIVFAGDGAMRPDVEAAAALDPRVVYLGRLPYAQVAGVVSGAVASLVPAFEPARASTGLSPLKLYESMACGVPVIVSDTANQTEVVLAERCGLVVRAGDPADLARALGRIVADPEGASEMGCRAREAAVDRHSWAARARARMAIVERCLAAARPDR